jgi:hypothetical protein
VRSDVEKKKRKRGVCRWCGTEKVWIGRRTELPIHLGGNGKTRCPNLCEAGVVRWLPPLAHDPARGRKSRGRADYDGADTSPGVEDVIRILEGG